MNLKIDRIIDLFKRRVSKKDFIPLNKYFAYGITGDVAHIHLPVMLRGLIAEKGIDCAIELVEDELIDALDKLVKLLKDTKVKRVFAVSPLLSQKFISDKFKMLGFKLEDAPATLKRYFKNVHDIQQASISIELLKKVLEVEKEAKAGMDKSSEMWHDKVLTFKYEKLKELGIVDKNGITLEQVIESGKRNCNYRHNQPIVPKKNEKESPDKMREESVYPKDRKDKSRDDPKDKDER